VSGIHNQVDNVSGEADSFEQLLDVMRNTLLAAIKGNVTLARQKVGLRDMP
jgi:hypothetical protein